MGKIVSFDVVRGISLYGKQQGKKIGLCHGTFDLFHAGHVKYLEEARAMVDVLFVSVTANKYVKKGVGRPVFSEEDRMLVLSSMSCVDYVVISDDITCVRVIENIEPDLYIKGSEYKQLFEDDSVTDRHLVGPGLRMEMDAVERCGGKFAVTTADLVTSKQKSMLRNDLRLDNDSTFISDIAMQYPYTEIDKIVEECKKLSVLVISDAIIDEYIHWSPMDRAPKTCILAGVQTGVERMGGGGIYIANHAAEYAGYVTLLTRVGMENSELRFVKEVIDERVNLVTFRCDSTPTKSRSVYITSDKKPQVTSELCSGVRPLLTTQYMSSMMQWLRDEAYRYDIIIVGDFGHGTMFPDMVDAINSLDAHKIVNVQSNESNVGFNLTNKYNGISYLTLDTYEAELALGVLTQKTDDEYVQELASSIKRLTDTDIIAVTMGPHGTMMADNSTEPFKVPVFTVDVLDAIGAGDVFMTISGIVGKVAPEPALMGFIGNCAGAIKVSTLCTSVVVGKAMLLEYISNLMS